MRGNLKQRKLQGAGVNYVSNEGIYDLYFLQSIIRTIFEFVSCILIN